MNEADLHAYFDGELPKARQAEVALWLQDHPEAQAMLDDWALQAAELRASFQVGEGLSLHKPAPRAFGWQAMAATVAVAINGASGGWALRGAVEPAATPSPVQNGNGCAFNLRQRGYPPCGGASRRGRPPVQPLGRRYSGT